jgi:3-deoxy-manno-octulosonate cytidylyltransferase (CMP-KDO synthetase)
MNIIGVIPARYHSTRLPFKLIRKIGGKTILQWVWEAASRAHSLDHLIIACDDVKIKEVALEFGAEVMMTSPKHNSGTDRIAEAVRDIDAKIVINIQADEPFLHYSLVDSLAQEMLGNDGLVMATAKKKIEDNSQIDNPSIVKVVCDRNNYALYFSRFPIPYLRDKDIAGAYYKHIGIYAYTKDFLFMFKNLPHSELEAAEKLEQLRVLEAGYKIRVIETKFDSHGVDTEADLAAAEIIMAQRESSAAKI